LPSVNATVEDLCHHRLTTCAAPVTARLMLRRSWELARLHPPSLTCWVWLPPPPITAATTMGSRSGRLARVEEGHQESPHARRPQKKEERSGGARRPAVGRFSGAGWPWGDQIWRLWYLPVSNRPAPMRLLPHYIPSRIFVHGHA
jgi:hypothetical protein